MNVEVGRDWDAHLYRCWVNGVEVTYDCTAADDVAGWATVLLRDALGRYVIDAVEDEVARVKMRGRVRLEGPGYRTGVYHTGEPKEATVLAVTDGRTTRINDRTDLRALLLGEFPEVQSEVLDAVLELVQGKNAHITHATADQVAIRMDQLTMVLQALRGRFVDLRS